ncbi:MAG: DUF2806 domain-containing protein [Nitrospinae bacterium]|nr:DUF2806 domain-containing protein [Nitrospinota bacterium]
MDLNVKALEKLLDYAASGIGSVAGSMLAPWMARRETKAKEIAAHGDANVLLIQAEAQTKAREILVSEDKNFAGELDIAKSINQRILFQEQKRQLNIKSVVEKAAEQLGDKSVPDTEPDHDWTSRFFSDVQDVSSEEMQSLWAKILAGEVERKECTSIRTLGILKNLDQDTARLFRRFCSACVFFSPDGKTLLDARVSSLGGNAATNSLKAYDLNFDALNRLNEYGLIISDYNSWYDYRLCIGHKIENLPQLIRIPFRFQDRHWILLPTSDRNLSKEFQLTGVALTRSGRELSGVIDLENMDEFSQALSSFFQSKNFQMVEVESHATEVSHVSP